MLDADMKDGDWNELIGKDIQLKITKRGAGEIAEVGELVRCKYVGRLQSTGAIFEVADDTGYRIGDSDTTPALELGLRHMRRGDKGLIRATAKYCFGPIGRKGVAPGAEVELPPNADVEYEAEVLDIYPPFNSKEAPLRTRLSEAGLKKAHGNGFFHHEDFTRAIRCYQAAIKALDPAEVEEEEEDTPEYKELIKTFCDVSNNLAAALMKLKRYKDVKEVVVKVIEVDPNNAKALYRGGVAAMRQDNYEEAEMALKEAFKLAPTDAAVRSALQELARLKEEYRIREKKMYRKMSGFLNKPSATGAEEGGDKWATATAPADEGDANEVEVEEDVEEEEEEERRPVVTGESRVGEGEEGEQMVEGGEKVEGFWRRLWASYVRNYEWVFTAVMIIGPVIILWPDLVKSWQDRREGAPLPETVGGEL